MSKSILKNAILGAVALLLVGCYTLQPAKQKKWHQRLIRAYSTVAKREQRMVTKQLVKLSGEPDLKVSPLELEGLLAADIAYRNKIFNGLWCDYRRSKEHLPDFHCDSGRDRWRDCKEFKKCSLWLYDESEHFKKSIVWGWGVDAGFTCYCFFVEQGKVVGVSSITHWRQLKRTYD